MLRTSLAAELNVLANQLARIAQADRHTRDFTLSKLRQALTEVIACFPVYRTYVTDARLRRRSRATSSGRSRPRTRRSSSTDIRCSISFASMLLADAADRRDAMHAQVRAFAMQVPAGDGAGHGERRGGHRALSLHRLASLNEVGGEPESFGTSVRQFHADAQHRARNWPHEMLATSTHDTKRSEDVRARINVLSEMPALWRKSHPALEPHESRAPRESSMTCRRRARTPSTCSTRRCSARWPLEPLDDDGARRRIASASRSTW